MKIFKSFTRKKYLKVVFNELVNKYLKKHIVINTVLSTELFKRKS